MKDKNEKNENKNEFYLFFLFIFILYSFCIFFVYIHFMFFLFTFILYFLCLHSLCVFSFYIYFVCFFIINVLIFFYFDFLHEQVKMSAQLQAFSSDSLVTDKWYIIVISIEADMIITNMIWKKISSQTVKLVQNEQVKKNWKRWLIEQIKSNNESDFQNVKIKKSKY